MSLSSSAPWKRCILVTDTVSPPAPPFPFIKINKLKRVGCYNGEHPHALAKRSCQILARPAFDCNRPFCNEPQFSQVWRFSSRTWDSIFGCSLFPRCLSTPFYVWSLHFDNPLPIVSVKRHAFIFDRKISTLQKRFFSSHWIKEVKAGFYPSL